MTCNAFAVLVATDGTTRIDLLNCGRWMLTDWEPFIPGAKGGGTWQDSPLSSGRQLVDYQRTNWIDVFTLMLQQPTQDGVIFQEQELLRLLEKAVSYWTSQWQNEPVWIEARAALETNTRYATIKGYRTPQGSGNPFGQPFILPEPKSLIEDFQLTIEHGPWLADEPGTGACVEISGMQIGFPYYLEFEIDDANVDCGSDPALDELPPLGFTVDGWVRPNGWGEGNSGMIMSKTEWVIRIDPAYGIEAFAGYTVTNALSRTGADGFYPDADWHHIAVTFNPAPDQYRIWVDGVEASYILQQAGVGVYTGDSLDRLFIGNIETLGARWDGDIGWIRVSDGNIFTANFTPPPRCKLPDIVLSTIAQWIGVENSGATIDNQEGQAVMDGTQTNCTFDTDCYYGRDETCSDEVYIANKHNRAQLTHIFVDDGGVFGGNLLGVATPFDLLPAVPVPNDAIYFGIDTTTGDSGPFSSLVFDIGTAITGVTTILWEIWTGAAWQIFTVQDNTDTGGVAFDTTGVNSVQWEPDLQWATTAVNGVTGYWVRARVTVAPAGTAPTQQNRSIYTILWPYIEIAADQIGGDIAALAQYLLTNWAGDTVATSVRDMFIALRSYSRGANFTAFLNAADEQNPTGITVGAGANTAFQNDIQAPSGRSALYSPAGVEAMLGRVSYTFSSALSQEYYGEYHAFIRLEQSGGAAGDFEVDLVIDFGVSLTYGTFIVPAGNDQFIDVGPVQIAPTNMAPGDIFDSAQISIQASNSNATPGTLKFIDLVLVPVDECAIQAQAIEAGGEEFDLDEILDVDNIQYPKTQKARSRVRDRADNDILHIWRSIGPYPAFLQANARQRVWFFWHDKDADNNAHQGGSLQMYKVQQYLYARGAR